MYPAPAPAPVAERLRVPPGADVLYIERLRRLNGLPLSLDLTYIPLDIGTALLGADLEALRGSPIRKWTGGER